jgi:heme/copper-type cytochrome/quinol oxidase subunit 2
VPIVLKSGNLNLLEPSGPAQACKGWLYLTIIIIIIITIIIMQLFVVSILYCVSATPWILALITVIMDGRVDREAGD